MRGLLTSLLLTGCILAPVDLVVHGERPIVPRLEYRAWYSAVEDCLGMAGNFDAIEWRAADEILVAGRRRAGVLRFPNTITIRSDAAHLEGVVRHEMVHHVTGLGDELHGPGEEVVCS